MRLLFSGSNSTSWQGLAVVILCLMAREKIVESSCNSLLTVAGLRVFPLFVVDPRRSRRSNHTWCALHGHWGSRLRHFPI